jgi:hypothetical protein
VNLGATECGLEKNPVSSFSSPLFQQFRPAPLCNLNEASGRTARTRGAYRPRRVADAREFHIESVERVRYPVVETRAYRLEAREACLRFPSEEGLRRRKRRPRILRARPRRRPLAFMSRARR